MGDRSGIEWLKDEKGRKGATWNPVRARDRQTGKIGFHCEHVSPGCVPCYAESINRWVGTQCAYAPASRDLVDIFLDGDTLQAPLRYVDPRRIFPCSMTDLFAEFVKREWIDEMFAVMALCPWHTFIIASKREARERDYLLEVPRARIYDAAEKLCDKRGQPRSIGTGEWPLKNVLVGVSVEDQRRADERRPYLGALAKAGWRTWVSYEPALGPVDWPRWEFLDWMVSGGQSGRGAEPCHPDWPRAARDFCALHGIAYHHKQNGEWAECAEGAKGAERVGVEGDVAPHECGFDNSAALWMARVGKKKAGRKLDGIEHDGFPDLEHARKAPAA